MPTPSTQPRLPHPGGDAGNWGQILNDYLSASHKPDGTLKDNTVTASTIAPGAITQDTLSQPIKDQLDIIAGQQGATGPIGATGAPGSTGPQGPAGATGVSGTPSTVPGPTGATGPQGPQGIQGEPGPAATIGSTGATGASGTSGAVGATGPAGATGVPGTNGATGASGTPGIQGATGPQGPTGTPGAVGATGAAGTPGTTSWAGITDKPAVIASGTTAANARAAIAAAPATGISLDATTDAADRLAMTARERTKLANLTGTVYITTTGAALPGDLADGTLIARYTASGPATPVVTNVGSTILTTGSTTMTVTTTATIPVGHVIAIAVNKGSATAGQVMGSAVASLSAGAVDGWTRASANRQQTQDTALLTARVTTQIPSGSTVTVTTSTNGTNRGIMIVAGISGVSSGTPNATSGDDAAGQDRDTSHGANVNNGPSMTVPTDAATTVPHTLVLGAFGAGHSSTSVTPGSGQTQIGYMYTEVGSADRGLAFGYKVATTTGVQSMTINVSPNSSMAGVTVALPIELIEV